jgi:hypothetical protein
MSRTVLISVTIAALALIGGLVWFANGGLFFESAAPAHMICLGGKCCCARTQAVLNGSENRPTLDPNQFVGRVKQAYVFARAKPALLAQLWCYCGCDKTDGHRSLLDCYRDYHGSRCGICTGEALLAQRMSIQNSPVDQIRDAIRKSYAGKEE